MPVPESRDIKKWFHYCGKLSYQSVWRKKKVHKGTLHFHNLLVLSVRSVLITIYLCIKMGSHYTYLRLISNSQSSCLNFPNALFLLFMVPGLGRWFIRSSPCHTSWRMWVRIPRTPIYAKQLWQPPVISALRRRRQAELCEFKATLVSSPEQPGLQKETLWQKTKGVGCWYK